MPSHMDKRNRASSGQNKPDDALDEGHITKDEEEYYQK